MKFIDTHSHLYSKEFDKDRDEVVQTAIDSGVEKILLPNISSKYTQSMLSLCRNYPNNCFPMMGLHPCYVNLDNYEEEIKHVKKELLTKKYIAVGEIGIDLHWDKSTLEIQKKAFINQILLAKENNLPIVIHVRNSFDETIDKEMEYIRNWHWMWSKFYFNKKHYGYLIALLKVFKNLISAKIRFFYYLITLNSFKRKIYQMRLLGLISSMRGKNSYYRPKI